MKKLFNKKFALILGSTITLLVVLSVAIVFLTKENTKSFTRSGYIIASSKDESNKYYFEEGTSYKTNINSDLVFTDTSGEKVNVETNNFLHYTDGGIKFLKNGVIMDLDSVNSTIVPYYNITNKSLLEYSKKSYYIESLDKTLAFNNLIGRISENKYIVAGVDINLQLAGNDNIITGDYFEITFIEDGVIKVENQEVSYQTTAENSYILSGDNIKIDLGLKKVYYANEEKMSLTQMTIDGNENIEIIPTEEEKNNNDGTGSGDGTNNDNIGNNNDNTGNNNDNQGNNNENIDNQPNKDNQDNTPSENPSDGTGTGTGDVPSDGSDENGTGSGSGTGNDDGTGTGSMLRRASIEMIEAEVGVNSLNAKFYINDPDKTIKGNLVVHITNMDSGKRVYSNQIKGKDELDYEKEFYIGLYTLAPDANYILSINEENNGEYDTQYFQKLFRTDSLGISLEKKYVTSNSVAYEVVFEEDSEVKSVRINLNDEKYNEVSPPVIINKDNNIAIFEGLKNNTTYNIVLDNVVLGNLEYNETYTSYKTTKTLKKTPSLSGLTSSTDEEKSTFTIGIEDIQDEDNSITKYSYYIYDSDEITLENKDVIEPVQIINKNDASKVKISIDEDKIKAHHNYKFKVIAEYYDNEKYGEYETELSENFILAARPYISFEMDTDKSTFNKIAGTITIEDKNCTVPINGRSCSSINNYTNKFKIAYYETNKNNNQTIINDVIFNPETLQYYIEVGSLTQNTEYIFEVYGDVDLLDGKGVRESYLIGTFRAITNGTDILTIDKWQPNPTGIEDLINVTSRIISTNNNDNLANSLNNLTFNLYSGNVKGELELGNKINPIAKKTVSGFLKPDYYKKEFIINTLNTFEFENLETLKEKTGGILQRYYTIEITDAYDEGYQNQILLENNIFVFETPAIILLEDQLSMPEIHADIIENQNLKIPEGTERIYEKDYDKKLADKTIVGYKVTTQVSIENISKYFGGGNVVKELIYYVCDADINKNCDINNAVAKKIINLEENSSLETIFYLNYGTDYNHNDYSTTPEKTILTRGHNYIFKAKFNIDTNKDNEKDTLYPTTKEVETEIKETPKQSATYKMYILKTTDTEVYYKYSFEDYDNTLYDKKFYYNIDDGEAQTQDFNENYTNNQYYDFKIDNLQNDSSYEISFKEALTKNTSSIKMKKIGKYLFDGKHVINSSNINFELITSKNDNRLRILILNNETNQAMLDRMSAIKVTLSAEGESNYEKTYPLNLQTYDIQNIINFDKDKPNKDITNLTECTTDSGTYQCIVVDYAKIKNFIKKDITVKLTAYYDSGIINNDFSNKENLKEESYILQNNNYYTPDKIRANYIYINANNGISTSKLPSGIYGHSGTDTSAIRVFRKINYYNLAFKPSSTRADKESNIKYDKDSILISDSSGSYQSINNKKLSEVILNTNKSNFSFHSITPKISVSTEGLVNGSNITITPTGLTNEILEEQFKKENDNNYYYYLKIYADEEKTILLNEEKVIISQTEEDGETTSSTIKITKYQPNTTYYFEVYADMLKDGAYERILLFDADYNDDYQYKNYSFSTLGVEGIVYNTSTPATHSSEYRPGEKLPERKLNLYFNTKTNIGDYQIRFVLLGDNGEELINKITSPNSAHNDYDRSTIEENITDRDFVFGNEFYTLRVYMETDAYNYESTEKPYEITKASLLIYDKKINLERLREPEINVEKYEDVDALSFTVNISDKYRVIDYGKYCVELLDKEGKSLNVDGYNYKLCGENAIDVIEQGKIITFEGLTPDTLYIFRVYADIYAKNVDTTSPQKVVESRTVLSTSTDYGVALGSVAAYANNLRTNVTLSFSSGVNITNIKEIDYSLMKQGGEVIKSQKYIMGVYDETKVDETNPDIIYKNFKLDPKDPKIIRLEIDPEGLELPKNSYIVVTYWVEKDGELVRLNNKSYDYSIEF